MKEASVLCFALDVNVKKKQKQESGHRLFKVALRKPAVKRTNLAHSNKMTRYLTGGTKTNDECI